MLSIVLITILLLVVAYAAYALIPRPAGALLGVVIALIAVIYLVLNLPGCADSAAGC